MFNDPIVFRSMNLTADDVLLLFQKVNSDIILEYRLTGNTVFIKFNTPDMFPAFYINVMYTPLSPSVFAVKSVPISVPKCTQLQLHGQVTVVEAGGHVTVMPSIEIDASDVIIRMSRSIFKTLVSRMETFVDTVLKNRP
jgi:hypothetical protein